MGAEATIERLEALRKVERMLATKAEREGARRRANADAITEAIDALGGEAGDGRARGNTGDRDIDVTTRGREVSV